MGRRSCPTPENRTIRALRSTGRLVLTLGLALAATLLHLGHSSTTAAAEDSTFVARRTLSLTGLAADQNRSVYWAVPSPTATEVVALRSDGTVRGTMTWQQQVVSVQALAMRNSVLYVGDIGDPQRARDTIQVLRFGETPYGEATPRVWKFRYADGRHDAAALMVSDRGNVYVVTRGPNPGIYRAEGQPSTERTTLLRRVARAPGGVSDAVFLPNSAQMALWADSGLYLMDGYDFSTDAIGPVRRTGEALTIGLGGEKIMLGRGGSQPRVISTDRPTGKQSISPTPTPTPSKKPTPKPSPTMTTRQTEPEAEPDKSNARTGTFWAIGGAAGLAVLAGLATVLLGRGRRDESDGATSDEAHSDWATSHGARAEPPVDADNTPTEQPGDDKPVSWWDDDGFLSEDERPRRR